MARTGGARTRKLRRRVALAVLSAAAASAVLAGHTSHALAVGTELAAANQTARPQGSTLDVATTTANTSTSVTAAARSLLCLGFLLPDARSVVTSAECAQDTSATSATTSIDAQRQSVVLVGTDHHPIVAAVSALQSPVQYTPALASAKSRASIAVGSLLSDSNKSDGRSSASVASTASAKSAIVFSHPKANPNGQQPQPQRAVRYDLCTSSDQTSDLATHADRALVLSQTAVQFVASNECAAAIPGFGVHLPLGDDILCGKSEWSSAAACRAAIDSTAAWTLDSGTPASQLVTIEQDGVEYALGFVVASSPCSMSANGSSTSAFVVTPVVDFVLGT